MFAKFDISRIPLVKVKFNTQVKDVEDFDDFLKRWMAINNSKKEYSMFFDTTDIGIMNPKYALRTASFIKELKKLNQKYLKESIVVVSNKYVRHLINFVLGFQKPSATVYIVDSCETGEEVYKNIISNSVVENKNVSIFYP